MVFLVISVASPDCTLFKSSFAPKHNGCCAVLCYAMYRSSLYYYKNRTCVFLWCSATTLGIWPQYALQRSCLRNQLGSKCSCGDKTVATHTLWCCIKHVHC